MQLKSIEGFGGHQTNIKNALNKICSASKMFSEDEIEVKESIQTLNRERKL